MKPIHEGSTILLRVDDALDIENVRRWLSDVLEEGGTASVTIQVSGEAPDVLHDLDMIGLIHEAVQGL